jgi:RNA polymerase sigma factor (sigma-70 family)
MDRPSSNRRHDVHQGPRSPPAHDEGFIVNESGLPALRPDGPALVPYVRPALVRWRFLRPRPGRVVRTLVPELALGRLISADRDLPAARTGATSEGLVRRAAAGDPEAFEALMRGVGNRLLATARKILRDPDAAEDAVQQTVILAWRYLPRLRDPSRFDGWMYKLLVSACYQEARRARRHSSRVVASTTEPATNDDLETWLTREALEQAFRALTPAHRAVVVLHHYGGLPLSEVAKVVGVSHGTARSRLHYAHQALRAVLEATDRPLVVDTDR